jgi:hypothetical protein
MGCAPKFTKIQVNFHNVSLVFRFIFMFLAKYRTARLENDNIILQIFSMCYNTFSRF